MDIFCAIDRNPKGHVLKSYGFFVKNRQKWKKDLTKSQQFFN